jgi:hypothetical protein
MSIHFRTLACMKISFVSRRDAEKAENAEGFFSAASFSSASLRETTSFAFGGQGANQ